VQKLQKLQKSHVVCIFDERAKKEEINASKKLSPLERAKLSAP